MPTLKPGQIVICDNLPARHSKEILALFQEARIAVLYTLLYIPDMNPIEMMRSKMKEILRQLRIRVVDVLERPCTISSITGSQRRTAPVGSEKMSIRLLISYNIGLQPGG